ncbi:hypothetical protein SAMN03159507_00208 [Pseudomonas sp. NFACC32-1]|jgi:hypothetical protein|uniref:hypothetical protein n=1 Tax=Pseudomonas TaxID=286 RepID=UPI000876639D|nr:MULTISPECIES: hypothetical protein [Pseudomonas]MDB6443422.1 hypothetical protein [Pseudomonas sp. 21TX0197]MDT8904411.1 hypothetical protein [Pseudomonas prosekii]NHN69216.1 hypothetical protein [Pseudomonas fluorescens]ROO35831.1 hypothetical protein BIV09_18500 [Pseudomonas sp. 7SR1]ROO36883.1 hypothetical protein BIV08_21550 [Pseudomonas sp. AF76]
MSLPDIPQARTRQEMRKALVRLRMEMHRQEIRQETRQLLQPLQRVRGFSQNWHEGFGIKHAPLWGMAAVTLLGFITGKRTRSGRSGGLARLVRLATTLLPLIKLAKSARKP